MSAIIYKPAKNAMQSGTANSEEWILKFAPAKPAVAEPLMGWTGSADTQKQVMLRFETEEEAVSYAKKHRIEFSLVKPAPKKTSPKSYADNFLRKKK